MRKTAVTIFSLAVLLYFFSCKDPVTEEPPVILSGKIENPNSDSLAIMNNQMDVMKVIYLNKDATFRDTFNIPEAYYQLSDGTEYAKIYLKPGFDLHLSLNTKEFDESISYTGKGAGPNNYLAKKNLLEEKMISKSYYGYYGKLNEQDFLTLNDSIYRVKTNFLKEHPNLDKDFVYFESMINEIEKLYKISIFEGIKRFVTGNTDFKVSDSFPDPFSHIDLSNEKLLKTPNYLSFIQSYVQGKSVEGLTEYDPDFDYLLLFIKTVKKEVQNPKIKEELLYVIGKFQLNSAKKLDSVYYEIAPVLTNKEHLNTVTQVYQKLKRIEKGAVSPGFELKDINGKTVTLSQLKGNVVFIDIWATWCLPCIKEIPDLKKTEKHFKGKNVVFVSICKSDTEERWRKMVADKKLGGIQLFAPDENIPFFKEYNIQGIPRFILIDKEGKIIDANAKRPSFPGLIEEIESYL